MKELSMKEKAKAYNKALEIAKKNYDAAQDLCEGSQIGVECFKDTLANIFPELKESGDEWIRKEIIKETKGSEVRLFETVTNDEFIAWLEKQGEKEQDERYENLEELLAADDIYQMSMNEAMVEEAKSKAINALSELQISKLLGLEKQGEQKSYSWKPTKEQFEALDYAYNSCSDTERGNYYEGVLETLIEDLHRLEKQGEQNSAWSKEDEKERKRVIGLLEGWLSTFKETYYAEDCKCGIKWLKSLKCRVGCEANCTTMWKPSEKQMEALKEACDEHWEPDGLDPLYTLYQELKKL